MNKDEIINKNQIRLAKIGLMAIANYHDVNLGIGNIRNLIAEYKKKKKDLPFDLLEDIVKNLDMVDLNLDDCIRIKYQKEAKSEYLSLEKYAKAIQKFFREYAIEVDIKRDCSVFIPKAVLIQVLINITDNALHFGVEEDNWKKWCKITVDGNKLTVSDGGNGIKEECKEAIFDFCFSEKKTKWKSADSETGVATDTRGLGLYVAKEHSKAFDFDISVENNTILKGANITLIFKNYK